MKKVAVSWSGGKDSCLALSKAMQSGYEVSCLLNTVSKEYRRVRFHGVPSELINLQATSLDIPLEQVETSADSYEAEFIEALKKLKARGTSAVVFGDIFPYMTVFAEYVCKQAGLEVLEPLCGRSSEDIFQDFIDSGFQAVVVATQANLLGKEWIGRQLDASLLNDIRQLDTIDVCGENGEFHSFVINGPLFSQRILVEQSKKVLRNGYWFLDLQKCSLKSSEGESNRLKPFSTQVQIRG